MDTNQETILIRGFRSGDEKALVKCFIELQNYEKLIEPRRLPGEQISALYIKRLVEECEQKNGRISVATAGERVVGFICIFPSEILDQQINEPTTVAYISDLVVVSDVRKKGVGALLMSSAEQYAKEQGVSMITVNVLAANEAACKFYANSGYSDYEKTLIKRLK